MNEPTTFVLIRHGLTDTIGKTMVGRTPGIHLNPKGMAQAEKLAARLTSSRIAAVYSSPLERALETATPLARALGLTVQIRHGLNELDFGTWAGRSLEDLEREPLWRAFHVFRSGIGVPGGEQMPELQARVVSELQALHLIHPGQRIALVTHADVIRGGLASCLGFPSEHVGRIEISPASVTVMHFGLWGPQLVALNDTGELLP